MNNFRRFLERWPLHLVLLPIYFIGHLYVQFSGLLDPRETAIAFVKILAGVFIFFLLVNLILRDLTKAAIISTLCCSLFLLFGSLKQALAHLPVLKNLSHYKILIPLLFILMVVALYRILRSKQLIRTTLFLNILFILYFIIDAVKLVFPPQNKIGLVSTRLMPMGNDDSLIMKNKLPDIYYILLDCYPSALYQEEVLGRKNKYLDSSLSAKGFHVINNPRSNYTNTAFSLASTLGMNYFYNVDTIYSMPPYYYNKSLNIIKNAPVFNLLEQNGYRFYNLSVFDFLHTPALKKDRFLSISTTDLIFYNTIWNCFRRDLLGQLMPSQEKITEEERKEKMKKFFDPQKAYNNRVLDSISKFPVDSNGQSPYFVYAHLLMPHFPYFYDSTGTPYPDDAIYTDSLIRDKNKFANYIRYTDNKVDAFITQLLEKTKGNALIILQSDHAITDLDRSRRQDAFRTISAFYFPDKDYKFLYDGMSNVNTFRVVFNKYFGQRLPILPDKTFYVR